MLWAPAGTTEAHNPFGALCTALKSLSGAALRNVTVERHSWIALRHCDGLCCAA